MKFLSEQHKKRYMELKNKVGFSIDRGEYASLIYLLTSELLFLKINNIFDINNGLKATEEIEEAKKLMSKTEIVLIDLALHLFTNQIHGDSINQIFSNLDNDNFSLAIESIKIAYGKKATF